MKIVIHSIKIVLFSILLFFSASFVTVFFDLNSPLHRQKDTILEIGFPLVYYKQFMVGNCEYMGAGWQGGVLLLDVGVALLFTTIFYIGYNKLSNRKS